MMVEMDHLFSRQLPVKEVFNFRTAESMPSYSKKFILSPKIFKISSKIVKGIIYLQ